MSRVTELKLLRRVQINRTLGNSPIISFKIFPFSHICFVIKVINPLQAYPVAILFALLLYDNLDGQEWRKLQVPIYITYFLAHLVKLTTSWMEYTQLVTCH